MKADGLTKLECSLPQRKLLLHHVDNPTTKHVDDNCDSSDEEDEDDISSASVVYSVYLDF